MTGKKIPQGAFTLIELLIVVVVILTITGLGLAAYNNFNQTQLLKQTAEDIKSTLRDAQNRALSGEKDNLVPPVCGTGSSSKPLNHWRFSITGNNTYTISGLCGGTTFSTKSYTTPTNITLSPTGNVDFKPLGQGVTQGFIPVITLTNTSVSDTSKDNIRITITSSGEITVGAIY